MSCETGFAIEIRERYQDVVADRWPAAVDPQPDELLSSWLHRLAIANGVAPQAFAGVLGLCGGMWSARLDLRLLQDLAAWLGARTDVAPEAISAMAMSDGALVPLWLPLRETARRSRSTWIQYCPLCLADDRAPYFRRSWRLASRISCFTHSCGLRDRCPACRAGIAPFAQTELVPQYVCVRCGFDLRGAAKISVEAVARRLETVDRRYLQGGNRQEFVGDPRMGGALAARSRRRRHRVRPAAHQPAGVGAHPLLRAARAKGRR
ncbi:Zn ribbon nucleic-acid-binding protein [Bradyrhizobium elkanii]|uniref:TniQ family protein n=1 Tax=Bradyrhizobium elkanii TaxID=29448 RepID=UPI0035195226